MNVFQKIFCLAYLYSVSGLIIAFALHYVCIFVATPLQMALLLQLVEANLPYSKDSFVSRLSLSRKFICWEKSRSETNDSIQSHSRE